MDWRPSGTRLRFCLFEGDCAIGVSTAVLTASADSQTYLSHSQPQSSHLQPSPSSALILSWHECGGGNQIGKGIPWMYHHRTCCVVNVRTHSTSGNLQYLSITRLNGITILQTYIYYRDNAEDSKKLKILVSI